MKPQIELGTEFRSKLIKTTGLLIEKINREIPMLKKSITEVPNAHLANEVSLHFASAPLLVRLSLLDLNVLFKLYLESDSEIEKNVLIRSICGQLYEFSEDVLEIFGEKYRMLLNQFPNPEDLTKDFNSSVIKEFNLVKQRHVDFLKVIRHNVSHHKDIDALLQYYLINEIDFNWAIKAYMDFIEWYAKYSDFELKLIDIAMKSKK